VAERDASAYITRHQPFALAPVRDREKDAFAFIRRHLAFALPPVCVKYRFECVFSMTLLCGASKMARFPCGATAVGRFNLNPVY
jgi:hypothetical protein